MDSILTSIKKMLGIQEDYDHFDPDITMHINSVFMILSQLGVGPEGGYRIEDKTNTWDEYISEEDNLDAIKTYIHLQVKLLFDPPQSSAVIEAMKRMVDQIEWRLNVEAEQKKSITS